MMAGLSFSMSHMQHDIIDAGSDLTGEGPVMRMDLG